MGHPNLAGSSSLSFTLDQASYINETHFPQPQPGPSSGTPSGESSQPSNLRQEVLPINGHSNASSVEGPTEGEQNNNSGSIVHGAGQPGEIAVSSGEAPDNIKQAQSASNSAAQTSGESFDSRPRTQMMPMEVDPDTTIESWVTHPDDHVKFKDVGNDTADTEMEPVVSEVKILSQQSGTSSTTIPDTYEHEDGPTILPPLEDGRSGVLSSPPRSAMEHVRDGIEYSSFASPVRLSVPVSNMRESVETPDQLSKATARMSDQTRTPVHTRFEFGQVVHTSPLGEQVLGNIGTVTGDQAKEQDPKMDGEVAVGRDLGARKGPVGVGFAFGRTS
jgi:hypothetical protein